ncbi:hypothetical protein XELAEV_18029361mg, partial [Xenopus laevis]
MELIIDFHSKQHKLVQSNIKEIQSNLLQREANVETAGRLESITKHVNKLETELKHIKREKFLRDKKDYELNRIYDWNYRNSYQSSFNKYRPRNANRTNKKMEKKVRFKDTDPQTSDSEASSSSFLYTEGDSSQGDMEGATGGKTQKRSQFNRERVKTRSQLDVDDSRDVEGMQIFETIIDINKFVRKLTLMRHFESRSHETDIAVDMDGSYDATDSHSEHDSNVIASEEGYPLSSIYDPSMFTFEDICLKDKSDFYPIESRGPHLDLFQKLVTADICRLKTVDQSDRAKNNLNKQERQALCDLAANKSIVIKNADKGGSV